MTVVGAPPQFIKAAPLCFVLRKEHEEFLVHTGQHYDDNMSDVVFRELGSPAPNVHLGVASGSHAEQTAAMLRGVERILLEQRPDAVRVFGDTNSTLAGALAAAKLGIPIAHVEAGLRSFNREMPEEINRVLADHMSTWLFAPSQSAVEQLAREGITRGVYDVGDIMVDSIRLFAPAARQRSDVLKRLQLHPREYCVATVHRASNTDCRSNLESLLQGFQRLPMPVVFPMHPRTRAAVARHGIDLDGAVPCGQPPQAGQIAVVEPLGYLDMLQLQQHAAVILTDSGGMQKEAYWLGVPCVTLREETEWRELVEIGANQLCPPGSSAAIAEAVKSALRAKEHDVMPSRPVFYGDGHAASRIVAAITGCPTYGIMHEAG